MKTLMLIVVLLGSGQANALVGGRKAAHPFPSVVWMEDCTVTKIGEQHFLTAAHCVVDPATYGGDDSYQNQLLPKFEEDKTVLLDRNIDHKSGQSTHKLTILRTFVHPVFRYTSLNEDYLKPQAVSDVAVVIVKEKTPEIPIAQIQETPLSPGDKVIKLGFGCPEIEEGKIAAWISKGDRELKEFETEIVSAVASLTTYYDLSKKSAKEQKFYSTAKAREFLAGSFQTTRGKYHQGAPKKKTDEGDAGQASLGFSDSGGPLFVKKGKSWIVAGVNAKSLLWDKAEHGTTLAPVAFDLHTRLDSKSFTGTWEWLQGVLAVTPKNVKSRAGLDGQLAIAIDPKSPPKEDDTFATRKYLRSEAKKLTARMVTASGEACPLTVERIELYDLNLEEGVIWASEPDEDADEKPLKVTGPGLFALTAKDELKVESAALGLTGKKSDGPICLFRLE